MDAAMNRVAQEFGTRDNIVILFVYIDEMFIRGSKTPDCVLNALRGGHIERYSTAELGVD
jgi:hypothetical protein